MIAGLLLTVGLALSPADTPIEPIPADMIEIAVISDIGIDMCDAYAALGEFVYATMAPGDANSLMTAVDQWIVNEFEEGWEGDEPGSSARLTDEAEVVLLDFLHRCL